MAIKITLVMTALMELALLSSSILESKGLEGVDVYRGPATARVSGLGCNSMERRPQPCLGTEGPFACAVGALLVGRPLAKGGNRVVAAWQPSSSSSSSSSSQIVVQGLIDVVD